MRKVGAIFVFFISLCWKTHVLSQGMAINSSGTSADTGAMLDVNSTNKGILIPRLDYSTRPLTGVANGMLAFITANGPDGNNAFYYFNGTAWVRFYNYNEHQNLSLSNDTLTISLGNYVDLSDVFPVAGYTKCGNAYYNFLTDNNHCGSCLVACPSGQNCISGVCH